jgi:hypothetical protein
MRTKFCLVSLKGTDYSEDLGVGGRIILKWMFKAEFVMACFGFVMLRMDPWRAVLNTVVECTLTG